MANAKSDRMSESVSSQPAPTLAQVRAEVAQALRQPVPDAAQLARALELVEQLIAESRGELAALTRELESLVEVPSPQVATWPPKRRTWLRR